mmetsp:Transcript_4270/g.6277  ORF Transcript_4270/g.6277 Transcript_4270/m.6277 type:complete len:97 (+) Transcript_4270:3-293(+)
MSKSYSKEPTNILSRFGVVLPKRPSEQPPPQEIDLPNGNSSPQQPQVLSVDPLAPPPKATNLECLPMGMIMSLHHLQQSILNEEASRDNSRVFFPY